MVKSSTSVEGKCNNGKSSNSPSKKLNKLKLNGRKIAVADKAQSLSAPMKSSRQQRCRWPAGAVEELGALIEREGSAGYGVTKSHLLHDIEQNNTAHTWRHKICDW